MKLDNKTKIYVVWLAITTPSLWVELYQELKQHYKLKKEKK